ncbi:L-dopachrome tautomerase-related protein [Rhizobium sp. 57MFTsu3.2]|uniref:L-dopachrome tautomerase-related protein n=1 Tax=Rhizobium sp. 57MFTsu3.2 TaxID=1048681 RepID=UPI00146B1BC6|nr:L-dopachrome tautomerase-related protein [Rhizobium sp. 57MFTsu3.2]NMN71551.1 sugar lactone lactonase YvrE [Rhizobium sp. 57MFTsu3.2]
MSAAELEIVATFDVERPGNPTVMRDGRTLISVSAVATPDFAVRVIGSDGNHRPYPNEIWAGKPRQDGRGMTGVIGIRADKDDVVWMLDMGDAGNQPKLVAWNDRADRLHQIIVLPQSVLRFSSFAQDFVIDAQRKRIYIADMTLNANGSSDYPAIIVVDLVTGLARRVLENHPALQPDEAPVVIDGKTVATVTADGRTVPYRYGLNPIAIDPLGRWVYFGALSGKSVYRIDANILSDDTVSAEVVAGGVEFWCAKPPCDGFDVDAVGNVYITDIVKSAIGVASPAGYRVLVEDTERLGWPDGVELDVQGHWLYITSNQLHRHPLLNSGDDASRPPYYLLRLRVDAPMTA